MNRCCGREKPEEQTYLAYEHLEETIRLHPSLIVPSLDEETRCQKMNSVQSEEQAYPEELGSQSKNQHDR